MRRTFSGSRMLTVALTLTAASAAMVSCSSTDGSQDAGTGSQTGGSRSSVVDLASLGLSVGDCVADLGGDDAHNAEDDAVDSEPEGEPTVATTTATASTTATATATTGAPPVTSSVTSSAASSTKSAPPSVPDNTTAVPRTDCSGPHAGEVYAQRDLNNEVLFPGQLMPQLTAAVCSGDTFEDYVGTPFDISALDVITYAPSKESWATGDRTVTCVVTDPDRGVVTRSLKGAAY